MVAWGDLFSKGSIAEQLLVWQVLAQLAQPIMGPATQTIASDVWTLDPNVPVPAPIMAELVARGLTTADDGVNESSKSGTGQPQFERLVKASTHAGTVVEAFTLWRRGELPEGTPGESGATFYGALTDAGIGKEWQQALGHLKYQLPSGPDALNAYLQGQIDEATARDLWAKAGMSPDHFTMMFDANGTAPTPDMAGTMANRGIIPWEGDGPGSVSFHQAFLEGPWRNKWAEPMRRLMQYIPPPRTVTAMVHAGVYTDAQALAAFKAYGLSEQDAAAMLAEAHHGKTAHVKTLAKTDVVALYKAHKIDRAGALAHLTALGYSSTDAELEIQLAEVAKADTHLTAAINKVHTLYVARKITRDAAAGALSDLGLPGQQASDLMTLWTLELGLNVKQLTESQIVAAWKKAVLTDDEATTELQNIGYTPFDAWVLLSTANGKPLPNRPPPGASPGVNP